MSKLTEEQERKLLDDFRNGMSVRMCMSEYNAPRFAVEEIIRREVLRIQKEEGI